MKLNIVEDKENPLLNRREIEFEVEHEGSATPKKLEVSEMLAAKLNANTKLMIVRFYTQFGSNVSRGSCMVYKDSAAMERAEPTKLLNEKKRLGKAPEAKPEEKEEPKKAEEKPAGETGETEKPKGDGKDEAQADKEK